MRAAAHGAFAGARGHETCEGCAKVGVAGACGRWQWGLRWSSLRGHETCEGVPKWAWLAHAGGGTGPSVGPPMGPRSA
eukprot:514442-Pyramimonas_sp.AAC.1